MQDDMPDAAGGITAIGILVMGDAVAHQKISDILQVVLDLLRQVFI